MKICFLNSLYPPHGHGGAEMSLRLLAERLASNGDDCTVLTLTPGNTIERSVANGVKIIARPIPHALSPWSPSPIVRAFGAVVDRDNKWMSAWMREELEKLRPDVIHAHNLKGLSVSAWRMADRLNIPLVQTLHDYYVACPRSVMFKPRTTPCPEQGCKSCRLLSGPRRNLSSLPYSVTSVSARTLQRVQAAGVFAEHPRTRIIRGMNDPLLAVPAERKDIPPGTLLRLGFFGRLEHVKGVELLLEAVNALPREAVTLHIGGKGAAEYEARLRGLAQHPGIKFLGHVAPETFYPHVDLLIVPSIWEEPLARIVHEAQAYGVPSIVTPLGGLREIVNDGLTGFVLSKIDVSDLLLTLKSIVATGLPAAAMSRECQRSAAKMFNIETIVSQYRSVLSDAVENI